MTDPSSTLKDSKYVTANILLNKVFEVTVTADGSKTAVTEVNLPDDVTFVGSINGTATATLTRQRSVDKTTGVVTCAQITVTPLVASTDCTVYVLIR